MHDGYGTEIIPHIDRNIFLSKKTSPAYFSLDAGIQQERTQPHHGVAQMSMVQFLQKQITD